MSNLYNRLEDLGWLIKGVDSLFPETCDKRLEQLLDGYEDCSPPLTLITESGKSYQHEAEIQTKNDRLVLKRPGDWENPGGPFHLFFQGVDKYWYFFQTSVMHGGTQSLQINIPDKIYYLQRRRHKRVTAPSGTRAIFKTNDKIMDSVHVTDISVGGMLICSGTPINKYPVNSLINEIFIAIPPKVDGSVCKSRTILPLIREAKVVRSFIEQDTSLTCFGFSFNHGGSYEVEKLDKLVDDIDNQLL